MTDHREAAAAPRGKSRTLRRIGPPAALAAAIAVACMTAVPDGGGSGGDGWRSDPKRMDDFVRRFRKGQQEFGSGRDAAAEEIFRQLLVEEPDAAAVHHALAYIDWYRGRPAEALEGFERAARLAPDDGAIRRDCGLRLVDVGRPKDALPHLEAARKILEGDVETLCAIARSYDAHGRASDAEKALREARRVDPDSIDARALLARLLVTTRPEESLALLDGVPANWTDVVVARGLACERLDRWSDAADCHARLAEIAPEGAAAAPVLRDAAESLVRCGDAKRAAAVAERWFALERAEGAGGVRASVCLAVARAGAGDGVAAIAALDAAPLPPAAAPALRAHVALLRGHAHLLRGDAAAARAAIETVAQADAAVVPFERTAARVALGAADAAELERLAAAETARANDVAWARWAAARLAGDAAAAAPHRRRGAELSKPPGEHPGLLLRGASD